MSGLLDVNALIALLDTKHLFHRYAWTWFDKHHVKGWSTCPITQNGVFRILSNPNYGNGGASTPEVTALLASFIDTPEHSFVPDDVSLLDRLVIDESVVRTHNAVTDIYLVALAKRHGQHLVTLDRRISNMDRVADVGQVVVIPT